MQDLAADVVACRTVAGSPVRCSAPVIRRTSSRSDVDPRSTVATVSPDLMTVMRSPSCSISSIRCEMKTTPVPSDASRATIANSRSRVSTSSADVASSRISTFGSRTSARTIEIACRSESDSSSTARSSAGGVPSSSASSAWCAFPLRGLRPALPPQPVGAGPHVVEHRARPDDEHLLEDRDHARGDGVGRRGGCARSAREPDDAGVRPVDARQDLDERALAGAVLADDRVHLAGPEVERRRPQRLGRTERLGDVGDVDERRPFDVVRRPALGSEEIGHGRRRERPERALPPLPPSSACPSCARDG